ncbi:LysR family transcriptional regulator [Pelagibacterium xiamenense]|uniref:LysR family transcriptional regulator n=1 Tax=Pelagibacterium xiamenense TaxID=2901140 RepID=UPI001E42D927|nr:LysR family transcriptional regulator [Pelagibacterium xiamenense]MCD7059063.1 LysR family transcriptional regulator [Pelagibacterium xiamenense]
MSFDWNLAKTLLAVAEEGSLSAAARALGQTQPTVSRQIAALEHSLDVTLFERTGRSVTLTRAGLELLDHVRSMASGANMLSLAASGKSQSIEGKVLITASELMSAYVLPPILSELCRKAPLLKIDVVADNGVRDLMRREADIAIRHTPSDQPNLIARSVREQIMRFYASPTYLENNGEPREDDFSGHQIVSYIEADRMLGYLVPAGLNLTKANFRLSSSSQVAALQMACAGLGMIILPDQIAMSISGLVPVLNTLKAFSVPTWLVAHRELRTSRRIRLVFDHLADNLS